MIVVVDVDVAVDVETVVAKQSDPIDGGPLPLRGFRRGTRLRNGRQRRSLHRRWYCIHFSIFLFLFLSFSVFVVCEEGMFMACAMNRLKEIFRELGVILPEPASHLPPFFFVVVVFHPSFSFFL